MKKITLKQIKQLIKKCAENGYYIQGDFEKGKIYFLPYDYYLETNKEKIYVVEKNSASDFLIKETNYFSKKLERDYENAYYKRWCEKYNLKKGLKSKHLYEYSQDIGSWYEYFVEAIKNNELPKNEVKAITNYLSRKEETNLVKKWLKLQRA